VSAKKRTATLKISKPKAKLGIRRPSVVEVVLVKPMKKTRKFVLAKDRIQKDHLNSLLTG
jgi:hypothetical protein